MKQFLLKSWWIFPIISIACSLLLIPLTEHGKTGWVDALCIISLLLIIVQAVVFILCLINKTWWRAVATGIGGIISGFVFVYASLVYVISLNPESDSFGKDHPIPAEMTYEIPINEGGAFAEPMDSLSEDTYFQLRNSIQGGIYQYSLYYPALTDGEVFLRCFEATENIELSAERIQKASTVAVKDHTGFGLVADKQQFTIYEGDWGDFYAARIEVWHRDASTGKETKLLEKIYRVEGWMR